MVQIGFVLSSEQFPAPDLIRLGIAAQQGGFDRVWISDHFQPWMDNEGHNGQAWITLAALGQHVRHIALGTGVTCPSYRYNPAIIAQAFASLGVLYPGRVYLGVGSGEAINEKAATGNWGDYEERSTRLIEAVQLIRKLWQGNWVQHQGQYYQVTAKMYDTPRHPIPIYIAAAGEKSTRLAGQHGDGWITNAKSAIKPELREALRDGAKAAKKEPDTLSIHVESFVVVGNQTEAKAAAQKWRFIPKSSSEYVDDPDPRSIQHRAETEILLDEVVQEWVVASDATTHIEALQKLIDAGVTHIYIHSGQEDQQRVINFYSREVLPQVHHLRSVAGV